jgi:YfiH family protein
VSADAPEFIRPEWPAPPRVKACVTTRRGGVSDSPYDSFNLAEHVGDTASAVAANRRRLHEALALPTEPRWLAQVHGTTVLPAASAGPGCEADASFTTRPGVVCAVLTADCLPVLLCDRGGGVIAVAHAGWRGLAAGVLEASVAALGLPGESLLAWLGPAIGPGAFEVGDEVREAFMALEPSAQAAFRPSPSGRWLADLYALARQRLAMCGVHAVYGGDYCTYTDAARFYSYRRDGRTGRMATLMWLE